MIDELQGLPGLAAADIEQQLNALYIPCCHPLNNLAAGDDLKEIVDALIYEVWMYKGIPEGSINTAVVASYADTLMEAVEDGFMDWETPDMATLDALKRNVWHFSAAKNYQQLKALSQALIGDDGKLRTFSQFKQAAFAINDKHINQWLKAEYELAVAGSQMAGKWQGIAENADVLPLLEFDAVLDTQTTALCRSLHGTVLPVDHAFWKMYYPPNHFGCRSTVRQLASGKVTTDIPTADIPKMFQTNLGTQRLVFPPSHPYFDGLPPEVITKADDLHKGE